jgi:hypothetical protein
MASEPQPGSQVPFRWKERVDEPEARDTAGPFEEITDDYRQKAAMERLGYASPWGAFGGESP